MPDIRRFPPRAGILEKNAPGTFHIQIDDDVSVEKIALHLGISHPRMADVRVELISPDGYPAGAPRLGFLSYRLMAKLVDAEARASRRDVRRR